ncbi:MAG: hypothetical protein NXY57DRAFT_891808 [Lentinula lateritia]|nr:MAG: hypothetical protein NXY57DRAFT_891808 [Lentinula lateritia]
MCAPPFIPLYALPTTDIFTGSVFSLPSIQTSTNAGLADGVSSITTDSSVSSKLIRPNEHLATLMPRSLWKRDSLSSSCDTFSCSTLLTSFATFPGTFMPSTFQRKHHCRKCGGVFCTKCSSRRTPLLDTCNLPFLSPPRNTSVYNYISEGGTVEYARVCIYCWDQLYGIPRTTELLETPDTKLTSMSSMPQTSRRSTLKRDKLVTPIHADTSPLPLGELSKYPLCLPSLLCKASGGGRWVPKPIEAKEETPLWEVNWERKIMKEKKRKENPVIRDGGFCYRIYGARLRPDDGYNC